MIFKGKDPGPAKVYNKIRKKKHYIFRMHRIYATVSMCVEDPRLVWNAFFYFPCKKFLYILVKGVIWWNLMILQCLVNVSFWQSSKDLNNEDLVARFTVLIAFPLMKQARWPFLKYTSSL